MIRSSWKFYHGCVFGHGCHHKFRKSCMCVSGSRNSWRNFYHCGIGKIGNILLITQDFVDKFILFQRSNGSTVVRILRDQRPWRRLAVCKCSCYSPAQGGIKRWCCLTSVAYIRSAGGVCDRPAGWRVLADLARPAWLKAAAARFVAGLGGGL